MSEIQSNQDDKVFFFGEIHIDQLNSVSRSPRKAEIQVYYQVVNFKLDSGADVSVLPASVYDSLKPSVKLEPTNKVLLGPCNYQVTKLYWQVSSQTQS